METKEKNLLLKLDDKQKAGQKSFSESIGKYLRYWKWFVFSITAFAVLSIFYIKYTPPVYEVKAKILLENSEDKSTSMPNLELFNLKSNAENELEVLNTTNLIEMAVRKSGIYAQYFMQIGKFQNIELYGSSNPISIKLPESVLDTLNGVYNFNVVVNPDGTYIFAGIFRNKSFRIKATERDSQIILPFGPVNFAPGIYKPDRTMNVNVSLTNPSRIADAILAQMEISLASQTTTAINLKLKTTNIKKGTDFLNAFLTTYKEEEMREQTAMANNNLTFLNNFLSTLGNELSGVEKQVQNFKQSEGITDINSEAQLYVQRSGDFEQKKLEVGTQLGIINDLENYINKSENRNQLLPSGIGIENVNLNSLINEYNNLLLERKRISRTAADNNQIMLDLTDRIDALYRTVQSSVNNEKRNLRIYQQDLLRKDMENVSRIKAIPRQERAISDLSRKQDIKSQMYLFLLQKRDENYINAASQTPKFKVIGYPRSNGQPIAPEKDVIYLVAFLFGIFLPTIGITIKDLLHNTVENKEELQKISIVPILGEIPKNRKLNTMGTIDEQGIDGFTEMFRLLRTNLMYLLNDPDKKVVNIVSSMNGEGKTSIAINLAISLALLDKKVLAICLDIRKPKLDNVLCTDYKIGLSQYLSGQIPYTEILRPSDINQNLWVITAGPVPPNPNELLSKPALDELINLCRKRFDYIVIDTPPIGAVSDGLLLNRFADVNLYIVRAEYTPKRDIIEANEIYMDKKLNNMYMVLNDVDFTKVASYSHYKNKYGYGYGYYSVGKKQKIKSAEV